MEGLKWGWGVLELRVSDRGDNGQRIAFRSESFN